MNRLCSALIASLALLALSTPAWANGTSHSKQPYLTKNDTHYGHYRHKVDKRKIKAMKQFRELKKTYNRSIEDARQMFLEFLGSSQPTTDVDIQKLRDEYEQQIAQLNATIASQQEQLTQANATMASQQQQITQLNQTIASQTQQLAQADATIASQTQQLAQADATIASQQQQLTQAGATIASQQLQITQQTQTIASLQQQVTQAEATITSLQQQISDLNTTITSQQSQLDAMATSQQVELQTALSDLTAELNLQCDDRVTAAYDDGKADGLNECPATGPAGPPQQVNSWSTGSTAPYALDVDGSGNTYVLDQDYRTVAVYDGTGAVTTQWPLNASTTPIDLALDSNNNVYVLDAYANPPLQKFDSSGQPVAFGQAPSPISYPKGLFIDSQDNIYVADQGGADGHRILVFDPAGNLTNTIGEQYIADLDFETYNDIAVNEQNQIIYVLTDNFVARFDRSSGNYINAFSGDVRFPNSIAVGAQGQIFVADTFNNQIDQYDTCGNLMYSFDSNGELYRPSRIVVDAAGKLYLADERNFLIRVYQ